MAPWNESIACVMKYHFQSGKGGGGILIVHIDLSELGKYVLCSTSAFCLSKEVSRRILHNTTGIIVYVSRWIDSDIDIADVVERRGAARLCTFKNHPEQLYFRQIRI